MGSFDRFDSYPTHMNKLEKAIRKLEASNKNASHKLAASTKNKIKAHVCSNIAKNWWGNRGMTNNLWRV